MINEVRIYDGHGNLKEIVLPVLTSEPLNKKKFQPHECRNSKCKETTTKKNYCSSECMREVMRRRDRIKRAEAKAKRPKKFCVICKKTELVGKSVKYCSDPCRLLGAKLKHTNIKNRREIEKCLI